MVYSIIQKSQLEGANRLDAEYYQPEYLDAMQKISKAPTIAELASDVRYGLYLEPDYLEEGTDFIRAMNLFDTDIDGEILKIDGIKVSTEYKLNVGDCLITRSGANTGATSVVYPKFQNATFGSYTIRMRFNKINPFFACLFLNTKYGIFQTLRLQTGMAQPNLNIPNIEEIKIPLFSEDEQKQIEALCLEVQNQKEISGKLYQQAEKLLLEELGMGDWILKQVQDDKTGLFNVINFLDIKSAQRMDAEYFQPKYEKLTEKIKNYGCEPLGKVLENVDAKFSPKPDEQYKYVELSNINASIGVVDGFSEVLGKEAPSRAKRVLKTGDVIVSSVEGSLGKVALIAKEQQGFLASTGFFQFRGIGMLPEVLLVLAKSIVFRMQLEKFCAGTILTAVPKEAVKNLLVPILPQSVQKKISDLVIQSHAARKKAKELLEEAKRKVENLIENPGKE